VVTFNYCFFQTKVAELEKLSPLVEEQRTTIASLEEKTGWLERRLQETEVIGHLLLMLPSDWSLVADAS